MTTRIPIRDVQQIYNSISSIWDPADYWHFHLHERYLYILKSQRKNLIFGRCLNLGSANQNYDLCDRQMIYFDAAERSLPTNKLSVCGDAHGMPFGDKSFNSIIAVGSVLNYCSPSEMFLESQRILERSGYLLFDFEQTDAFEHLGTRASGSTAHVFNTDFNGMDETIWIYSMSHIANLLKASGFAIKRRYSIHTLSSLVWYLTESNSLTATACQIDKYASNLPFIRRRASTIFIIAQKIDAR